MLVGDLVQPGHCLDYEVAHRDNGIGHRLRRALSKQSSIHDEFDGGRSYSQRWYVTRRLGRWNAIEARLGMSA